jgi:hypothetical protein
MRGLRLMGWLMGSLTRQWTIFLMHCAPSL